MHTNTTTPEDNGSPGYLLSGGGLVEWLESPEGNAAWTRAVERPFTADELAAWDAYENGGGPGVPAPIRPGDRVTGSIREAVQAAASRAGKRVYTDDGPHGRAVTRVAGRVLSRGDAIRAEAARQGCDEIATGPTYDEAHAAWLAGETDFEDWDDAYEAWGGFPRLKTEGSIIQYWGAQ